MTLPGAPQPVVAPCRTQTAVVKRSSRIVPVHTGGVNKGVNTRDTITDPSRLRLRYYQRYPLQTIPGAAAQQTKAKVTGPGTHTKRIHRHTSQSRRNPGQFCVQRHPVHTARATRRCMRGGNSCEITIVAARPPMRDHDRGSTMGSSANRAWPVRPTARESAISEPAYNHPMRTACGHHRAASGVAGRPWARDLRFRDALGVTDNGAVSNSYSSSYSSTDRMSESVVYKCVRYL